MFPDYSPVVDERTHVRPWPVDRELTRHLTHVKYVLYDASSHMASSRGVWILKGKERWRTACAVAGDAVSACMAEARAPLSSKAQTRSRSSFHLIVPAVVPAFEFLFSSSIYKRSALEVILRLYSDFSMHVPFFLNLLWHPSIWTAF